MKESTKNAFKKLSQLTCQKCEQCEVDAKSKGDTKSKFNGDFRCCDKAFCSLVESTLHQTFPKPNVGGIPYMSEKGCVIPPELRPYCSGYVCPPHLEDREFRREYERIIDKINQDPEAPRMFAVQRNKESKP